MKNNYKYSSSPAKIPLQIQTNVEAISSDPVLAMECKNNTANMNMCTF